MFSEGSPSGISVSKMGVFPAHLRTLMERNYQVAEKKEDDLHEQEEDSFDDDEDDTIIPFRLSK